MSLTEFTVNESDLLIRWIRSETLNYVWSGSTYQFPLDKEQIRNHCEKEEVFPYLYSVQGIAAGYIELFQLSKRHYCICRVFICEAFRGKGFCKRMLNEIIEKAVTEFGALKVSLGVFERNQVALHCYRQLGFKVTFIDTTSRRYKGEVWRLIRMEKWLFIWRLKRLWRKIPLVEPQRLL